VALPPTPTGEPPVLLTRPPVALPPATVVAPPVLTATLPPPVTLEPPVAAEPPTVTDDTPPVGRAPPAVAEEPPIGLVPPAAVDEEPPVLVLVAPPVLGAPPPVFPVPTNEVTLDASKGTDIEPLDAVTVPSLASVLLEDVVYLVYEVIVEPGTETESVLAEPVLTTMMTMDEPSEYAERANPDPGLAVASTRWKPGRTNFDHAPMQPPRLVTAPPLMKP